MNHFKSISKDELKSDIVKTVEPDHCDMIIEHNDANVQVKIEAVDVKHEHSLDSAAGDADSFNVLPVTCKEEHLSDDCNEETNQMSPALFIKLECEEEAVDKVAPIKDEIIFACTTCLKEFEDEDTYTCHVIIHMEDNQNPEEDPLADCPDTGVTACAANVKREEGSEVQSVETNVLLNPVDTDDHVEHILVTENKSKISNDKYIESNLASHVIGNTSEKSFVCGLCNCKFFEKSSLVSHLRLHTGVKPLTCKLCSYKCVLNSTYVHHMETTHTVEKYLTCKFCSYKCTQSSKLAQHMRTHTGEKPFACKFCSYKFTQRSGLVQHMRIHTNETLSFDCKLCSYKCTQNSKLVQHMRSHTGEKPFACKLCSYKFTQSSGLMQHMTIHTGEKPFACKLCSYKCTRNSGLVQHMRTHTGEKPFSCKLCSYKCTQSNRLVRHMRTHTGEKPFACKLCNYKCTQSSHLVKHNMRIHTDEKPFVCKLCGYKCFQNSDLARHMKNHTGEKSVANSYI